MTISGKELFELMGIDPNIYREFQLPKTGHCRLEVYELLNKEFDNFPPAVRVVSKGDYLSGEVWMDTFYEIFYLYVGKNKDVKDVVVELGGDTIYAGEIRCGIINSGDDDRIFFDKRIFSPNDN